MIMADFQSTCSRLKIASYRKFEMRCANITKSAGSNSKVLNPKFQSTNTNYFRLFTFDLPVRAKSESDENESACLRLKIASHQKFEMRCANITNSAGSNSKVLNPKFQSTNTNYFRLFTFDLPVRAKSESDENESACLRLKIASHQKFEMRCANITNSTIQFAESKIIFLPKRKCYEVREIISQVMPTILVNVEKVD